MAVRFYDEALANKIKSWTKDSTIRVLKPNEVSRLFQIKNDETNDATLQLPLISIARDPSIEIKAPTKKSLSYDGKLIGDDTNNGLLLNAIPIEINYQIDIYTQYYEEGDEYLRNFVFNLINYPKMKVVIPYNNTKIEHNCYIELENTVTDNTDVSEHLFDGQFTRWSIRLKINDAYLFSVPYTEKKEILDNIDVDTNIDIR